MTGVVIASSVKIEGMSHEPEKQVSSNDNEVTLVGSSMVRWKESSLP